MANPNKTVAAARKQRTKVCVEEKPFGIDQVGAEAYCESMRAAGKHAVVRSHTIGPRTRPSRQYRVCVYEPASQPESAA